MMMRILILALTAFLRLAIAEDRELTEVPRDAVNLDEVFNDPAGIPYFQEGEASNYTRHLAKAAEPSLRAPLPAGVERILRFSLLRSFDYPIIVKVTFYPKTIEIDAAMVTMDHEYRFGTTLRSERMEIGKERIPKSFSALDRTDFWSPATEAERYFEGMDGSTWLFEERTAECPRAIAVWSPASKRNPEYLRGTDYSTTDVRDYSVYWCLGKDLLDLAKLAMPDPQLY